MRTRRARQLRGKFESLDRIIGEVRQTMQTMGNAHVATPTTNASASKNLEDLEVKSRQLETLAKSVRDDYQSVRAEAVLQREVTLRLFALSPVGTPLDTWRRLEDQIRRQIGSEWARRMMREPPESDRRWACVPEHAETYKMDFPSSEAALAALEGQAGELVCYERGFPIDVAVELFDVDLLLEHAEAKSGAQVLGREEGLFASASDEDLEKLRHTLAATVVDWVEQAKLPIYRIVEREEVEPTDAKDCPA